MDLLSLLSSSPSAWVSEVAVLDEVSQAQLGTWLVDEWIQGRLEPRLLPDDADEVARRTLRRQLAATVAALGIDDVEAEWHENALDADDAARWCWVMPWRLLGQDEDLLLLGDCYMQPLLAEAAADCPKRATAIHVVEHHVRHRACAALVSDADGKRLQALARLHAPAVSARADELVEYLDRVMSYANSGHVTFDDARRRIIDLAGCHPLASVAVERRGAEWWSPIDTHPVSERWMVICERTGGVRIESPSRDRRRAKGRHNAR